jgi:two-component system sensor histidine kinase FlrB
VFAELVEDEQRQSWIDISVEDDGPGISEAEREKILTPFYTTRAGGTGLGLAVVQSIAKAHKGSLWIDSDEGEGSTFGLRLPMYQSQIHAEMAAAKQECAS